MYGLSLQVLVLLKCISYVKILILQHLMYLLRHYRPLKQRTFGRYPQNGKERPRDKLKSILVCKIVKLKLY